MMNYSKRSDGRRLLLVIALFGILSTYGISTANVQVTNADAASTEESAAATTAGDQSTVGGLTPEAAGGETTSEAEKVTGVSVGETATQSGGSLAGGTSDEQTGSTEGGSSIIGGDGTVETSTSDGKFSTAEGVSSVRTGGGDVGLESSTGGTEGGTTATVKEAPSATGATGTEKQITEGETTAAFTGATSTDEKEDGPFGAGQLEETTGVTTAEENTTSVKQTSIAADAQYTTNRGDTSAERHTETPAPIKVTVIAVSSTLAPIECGSKEACVCRNTTTRASSADRPQWTISGSVWKAGNIYHAEFVYENQRNLSQRKVYTKESRDQLNCSTEVIRMREELKKSAKNNSTAPVPLTSPAPTPASSPLSGPINRKRRQAATSVDDDDVIDVDLDFDDIDAIMDGYVTKDDADYVTNESSKNPTLALQSSPASQSSPQSTESLAESGIASDTTSTVLTLTSTVSAKADDPKAVKEPTQTPKPNVWDAHRGIFLTVAILISVCVVVTAFCCLCMKWRERGGSRNPEKHPIAMEEAREAPTAVSNPITDREMIQDEAPMQERENPAVTPNGGGQHISKADEDNGWVVPLDELSNAEKEKPEVENTRL